MPNIERFFRQGLEAIAQQIGLRPKRFPSEDEAVEATIKDFFNGDPPVGVLNLPPGETSEDPPPSVENT